MKHLVYFFIAIIYLVVFNDFSSNQNMRLFSDFDWTIYFVGLPAFICAGPFAFICLYRYFNIKL